MPKFYKSLIIITCLICSFFFGKWVMEVWPRYKWDDKIVMVEEGETYNFTRNAKVFCDKEVKVYHNLGEAKNYECLDSKGQYNGCIENPGNCYVKERIRIK